MLQPLLTSLHFIAPLYSTKLMNSQLWLCYLLIKSDYLFSPPQQQHAMAFSLLLTCAFHLLSLAAVVPGPAHLNLNE